MSHFFHDARTPTEDAVALPRRMRSLALGAAGILTIAGATLAGPAPASAHDTASTEQSTEQASYAEPASAESVGGAWEHAVQWAVDKANDPNVHYGWGGTGPNSYDCSGFTEGALAEAGIEAPRTSGDQFAAASEHVSLDQLQVGDLVFWSNDGTAEGIYHVALYIGDGQIAHARNAEMGVAVTDVDYSPHNMLDVAARY
ncbi:NlpC/P60 family protein [Zhihengliuella sp.]|uniref:C40 family peptidase n=1 Tax=Zhihengliuella sp. TaxID=1954483 RepID=UPI002810B7BC|nr:NlpC/P60 family protein [Zhihengliuella sp.]